MGISFAENNICGFDIERVISIIEHTFDKEFVKLFDNVSLNEMKKICGSLTLSGDGNLAKTKIILIYY